MANLRAKRAKLNIIISFACQIVSVICGIILPKVILGAYGSEAYGATSSITNFLAYITLLEGGVSGVARAALYKPLAENDVDQIGAVVYEIKRFFRILGIIFSVYVIVLACSFKSISHTEAFSWTSSFLLVLVISISTFGQYFIGISNTILLQAGQQKYITYLVTIVAIVLNTVLSCILIELGCGLIIVKFVSSCVYVLRPIALWAYVKKHYVIVKVKNRNKEALEQKWTALGQHIAYFLHSNTDVAVLTVLENLTTVSVYSVYHMVTSQIQNLTVSFTAGMEALFGDMLAKKEHDELNRTFDYYETIISLVSVVLFSVTGAMIVSFVRLYTANISDADYRRPVFAILMVIACFIYCLRIPYHYIINAAGHFEQTKIAAYGEAVLNITLSILLVYKFGLVGVAIGTVVANLYRFVYYVWYLNKNVIFRPVKLCVFRELVNSADFLLICTIGNIITNFISISNYFIWAVCGAVISIIACIIVLGSNLIFYKDVFLAAINRRRRTN